MAEHYPTAPQVVDPVERVINDTIGHLICLQESNLNLGWHFQNWTKLF